MFFIFLFTKNTEFSNVIKLYMSTNDLINKYLIKINVSSIIFKEIDLSKLIKQSH